jgi:predicted phage terminase large subunit-like protein
MSGRRGPTAPDEADLQLTDVPVDVWLSAAKGEGAGRRAGLLESLCYDDLEAGSGPEGLVETIQRFDPSYQKARHIEYIAKRIEALPPGGQLVVCAPPRHGKSLLCSVGLPVWVLLRSPQARIIIASYEADFARTWGRRVRDAYRALGGVIRGDVAAASRWDTPEGGGLVAVGVGGPITGRGADWLIVDDAVKNAAEAQSEARREAMWDWWRSVARTRLEPEGRAVVIGTRWHEDDLLGRLLREEGQTATTVCLRAVAEEDDELGRRPGEALWPERFPLEELERIRAELGGYWWNALYQQRPADIEGAFFRRSWFRYAYREGGQLVVGDEERCSERDCRRIAAVDLATSTSKTADYTVGVVGLLTPGRRLVVVDVWRERAEGPDVTAMLVKLWQHHEPERIAVESNGYQLSVIQALRREGLPVVPVRADKSKEARALYLATMMEAGSVYMLRGASWLADLEAELLSFPRGQHDDQVDALVYLAMQAFRPKVKVYK